MGKIRRFNKNDWDGFAGAEKFADGTAPFIYEQEMNEGLVAELTIVVDRNDIEITIASYDGQDKWVKRVENPMSSLRAEGEIYHWAEFCKGFTYAPALSYALDHSREIEYWG